MVKVHLKRAGWALGAVVLSVGSAMAGEKPSFDLTIKNHRFEPASLTIPANTKVALRIKNADTTAEEFESETLRREKVIAGGETAVVYIGPLEPGTYPFVGEFHMDTAKGEIIVK